MTTHSSICAWEIPWTEEPGGLYSPWGHKRVRHNLETKQKPQLILDMLLDMLFFFFKF